MCRPVPPRGVAVQAGRCASVHCCHRHHHGCRCRWRYACLGKMRACRSWACRSWSDDEQCHRGCGRHGRGPENPVAGAAARSPWKSTSSAVRRHVGMYARTHARTRGSAGCRTGVPPRLRLSHAAVPVPPAVASPASPPSTTITTRKVKFCKSIWPHRPLFALPQVRAVASPTQRSRGCEPVTCVDV